MKIRPLIPYRGSILILDLSGHMVSRVRLDDAYCVPSWVKTARQILHALHANANPGTQNSLQMETQRNMPGGHT